MVDFCSTITQCDVRIAVVVVIIGIFASHLAQGGIALNLYEVLKCLHHPCHICSYHISILRGVAGDGLRVNLEHGLVCVFQLPHQHKTNHHGITRLVVHLDRFGVEVTRPER